MSLTPEQQQALDEKLKAAHREMSDKVKALNDEEYSKDPCDRVLFGKYFYKILNIMEPAQPYLFPSFSESSVEEDFMAFKLIMICDELSHIRMLAQAMTKAYSDQLRIMGEHTRRQEEMGKLIEKLIKRDLDDDSEEWKGE